MSSYVNEVHTRRTCPCMGNNNNNNNECMSPRLHGTDLCAYVYYFFYIHFN